jgi:hypothetical protein
MEADVLDGRYYPARNLNLEVLRYPECSPQPLRHVIRAQPIRDLLDMTHGYQARGSSPPFLCAQNPRIFRCITIGGMG